MTIHYRKDHKNGITPPNPEGPHDVIAHITKHRGMKTPYTSVSEDKTAIKRFTGVTYKTDSIKSTHDSHLFIAHADLLKELQRTIQTTSRTEKILAERAYLLAQRAKEALIDWQFNLNSIKRTERIKFCYAQIQHYFTRD